MCIRDRTLGLPEVMRALRADAATRGHCLEDLDATNPKTCSVAAGESKLRVEEVQLLGMLVEGYEIDDMVGPELNFEPQLTKFWTNGLLADVPFGESEGLSEDFILGFPECLRLGVGCHYRIVAG